MIWKCGEEGGAGLCGTIALLAAIAIVTALCIINAIIVILLYGYPPDLP